MNKTTDNDKRQVLRVFGLDESELEALRKLAEKEYGKASVSLLAKKLLKARLEVPEEPAPGQSSSTERQ